MHNFSYVHWVKLQKISGHKLIGDAVTCTVYGKGVGLAVAVSVKAILHVIPMQHIEHIVVAAIAVNRWVMQKNDRFEPCIDCGLNGHIEPERFPCDDLCVGRLTVVVYPASCTADAFISEFLVVVLDKVHIVKAVIRPEFLDLAAGRPPQVVITL